LGKDHLDEDKEVEGWELSCKDVNCVQWWILVLDLLSLSILLQVS